MEITPPCVKVVAHTAHVHTAGARATLEGPVTVAFVMCKMISLQCNRLYYRGKRLSYPLDLLQRAQQMSSGRPLGAYAYPEAEK